jgi:hypothetical protein
MLILSELIRAFDKDRVCAQFAFTLFSLGEVHIFHPARTDDKKVVSLQLQVLYKGAPYLGGRNVKMVGLIVYLVVLTFLGTDVR